MRNRTRLLVPDVWRPPLSAIRKAAATNLVATAMHKSLKAVLKKQAALLFCSVNCFLSYSQSDTVSPGIPIVDTSPIEHPYQRRAAKQSEVAASWHWPATILHTTPEFVPMESTDVYTCELALNDALNRALRCKPPRTDMSQQ